MKLQEHTKRHETQRKEMQLNIDEHECDNDMKQNALKEMNAGMLVVLLVLPGPLVPLMLGCRWFLAVSCWWWVVGCRLVIARRDWQTERG